MAGTQLSISPRPATISGVKARFEQLLRQWKRDTEFVSSTQEIVAHRAYQKIIELDKPALPLILGDLRDHGGEWFHALRQISHENPVTPEIRGDFEEMRNAWIAWGQSRRYI